MSSEFDTVSIIPASSHTSSSSSSSSPILDFNGRLPTIPLRTFHYTRRFPTEHQLPSTVSAFFHASSSSSSSSCSNNFTNMPDSNPIETLNLILHRLNNLESMSIHLLLSTWPPMDRSIETLEDILNLIPHRLDSFENMSRNRTPNNPCQGQSGCRNPERDAPQREPRLAMISHHFGT